MSDKLSYSQLRNAPRAALRDVVPLRAPFTLFVEPTNVCNYKCVYCPESLPDYAQRAGGMSRLDLASFERIARQVAEIGGVKAINFYMMGEPFVNKALPDFIRIAREQAIADRLVITSNATLLTEEAGRKVIEAGLDYLRVSIYGGTQEASASRTQSKIPLERVRQNVAGFFDLRNRMGAATGVYVKMIDSGDPEENASFLNMFRDIADEVVLEPVMNWNDPEGENLSQRDPDTLIDDAFFAHKKSVCPMPFYTLVIHADLRVSVCCVDWAKEAVVGDLKSQSLREVWQGEALREFQLAHLEGRRHELAACRNCTYLHTLPDNLDGLAPAEFLERGCRAQPAAA